MDDSFTILPARRFKARVSMLMRTQGNDFETAPVETLDLTFDGIPGDFHGGATRKSGGREPWYPRGTEMRNERQVSILAEDELAAAAADMGITRIEPGWIGGNLVLTGIPHLSMLPPRTLLFFEGGVTIRIDGQNGPCKLSGARIAKRYPDQDQTALALSFVKAAKRRRGLVAWVDKPGMIKKGESLTVQLWEQWVYPA